MLRAVRPLLSWTTGQRFIKHRDALARVVRRCSQPLPTDATPDAALVVAHGAAGRYSVPGA